MNAKLMLATPATLVPAITLRQRIADALTKDTSSAEVRSCLADAQGDNARVVREIKHAESMARDPLSTEEAATEAKTRLEALRFDHDRLVASVERLAARLVEVQKAEKHEAARPDYDSARNELYTAAKAITDEYPGLAGQLADLLTRARDADRRAHRLNFSLPDTFQKLPALEDLLRDRRAYIANLGNRIDYNPEPASLLQGVALPALEYGLARHGEHVWPVN